MTIYPALYQDSWDKIVPNDKKASNSLKTWDPDLFSWFKDDELEREMKRLDIDNPQTMEFLRIIVRETRAKREEKYEAQSTRYEEEIERLHESILGYDQIDLQRFGNG